MPQTVSIPFSEKMAKDDKKIIEYHDEDVLVSINDVLILSLNGCGTLLFYLFSIGK